ncbi:hypothetical protein L2E82_27634 [Cichorium intybus]|uniref:Uncharacterized protein n=1 Tax=Cichorium intybus TaxID=13427 RepID=A0ACB9CTL7_CICIN|nr:hypothetical protein L2E82_27634 [Cichorium intybus]
MKFFANMIESWFRRSFYSKCNSNIKLTLMRVEIIKRRRKAMEKYLRNDIADLMKSGYVDDAYRRAAGLYLDQNRSSCYDFVEQFCMLILNHLTVMNEQSECPEECREAVPSLVYAAARIADLPELRELRSLFSEKYGNSLEAFINKEFVNLLKRDHPTHDMKIQLLQEIALEHGLEWDPNSLEQNSYKPPPSNHDRSQSVYGDGDNGSHSTPNENGLRIKIQETGNYEGTNGELEKQTDQMRKRILDYWSRTTSLFSTSRETSTSSDDSSSDDSAKGRSFFGYRTRQINNNNKENQEVSNKPNIQILDNDATSAPGGKNKQRRNGGPSPRVKSHSTECLPNPLLRKTQKGHVRATSDMTAFQPMGHVHPKLPDYDDIKARFAALRAKS